MRPCWCKESRVLGAGAIITRFPFPVTHPPNIGDLQTFSLGFKCGHCGRLLEAPTGMWHVKYPNGSVDFEREGIRYAIKCVGPGWRWIIGRLWRDIRKMGWDGELFQVKEKFGGLRFYIGGATNEIHDRVNQAEAESIRTCEHCGRPGTERVGGWVKTLCDTMPRGTDIRRVERR